MYLFPGSPSLSHPRVPILKLKMNKTPLQENDIPNSEEVSLFELKKKDRRGKRMMIPKEMLRRCSLRHPKHNVQDSLCQYVTENQREAIFNDFWRNFNPQQKRHFIFNTVDVATNSQSLTGRQSFNYTFEIDGKRISVCAKMYLTTLGLKTPYLIRKCFQSVSSVDISACNSINSTNLFEADVETISDSENESYKDDDDEYGGYVNEIDQYIDQLASSVNETIQQLE